MKRLLLFFALISSLISCRMALLSTQNLSYLYEQEMQPFIPEYFAWHKNDTFSQIYFKINSGNLLYVKEANSNIFSARFKLSAELYDSPEMKYLLDSSSIAMSDSEKTHNKDMAGIIDIKASTGQSNLLRLIFYDLNKNTSFESYMNIYRQHPNCAQDFMIESKDSIPLFKPWVSSDQKFRIKTTNEKNDSLYVRYYDRLSIIALPPFSEGMIQTFNFAADSAFTIPISHGSSALITLPKTGMYLFQADSSTKDGFTVFRFEDGFPKITTTNQMLCPLRYFTTKNDYDDLLMMKSKKEAVDKFWIDLAGNAGRAKEMIRMFYNRVQAANQYFTSYIEGWKTDRGLIYIIYGEPNIVYRSKDIERWIYGEDGNIQSIIFTFTKVENPFSDCDYSLSRSPLYRDVWNMVVENWRR